MNQFIEKDTLAQVFPVNFVKFLRTLFLTEHLRRLLLTHAHEYLKIQESLGSENLTWYDLYKGMFLYFSLP